MKKDNEAITEKRIRTLSPEHIMQHVGKQALADKISILNGLKNMIASDKKALEEQLNLINNVN